MSSKAMRALASAALIIIAVVLFLVLKDDGGDSDTDGTPAAQTNSAAEGGSQGGKQAAPEIPTIFVKGGKPVGGIQEISVNEGERVRFRVDSDVSDEVHLHGYDIGKDVKAGGSVTFDFPATLEGVFEAELESRKEQILELRVNP
jgi:hypothetical protein